MKRVFIKSTCATPRATRIPRAYVPLGPSIRSGFNDGISEDTSPLMRNAFDSEHLDVDPYYSFGNDVIGRDKFERSVIFDRKKRELEAIKNTPQSEALADNNLNINSEVTE